MRRAWLLVVIVTAVVGATGAFSLTRLARDDAASNPAPARLVAAAETSPIPAQAPPKTPREPVTASAGACTQAMDGLRALIAAVPSGDLGDDAQRDQLTAGLRTLEASCDSSSAQEFREQELDPWLADTAPGP